MYYFISKRGIIFWVVVFLIILLILWLFFGGKEYEFIGLKDRSHCCFIDEDDSDEEESIQRKKKKSKKSKNSKNGKDKNTTKKQEITNKEDVNKEEDANKVCYIQELEHNKEDNKNIEIQETIEERDKKEYPNKTNETSNKQIKQELQVDQINKKTFDNQSICLFQDLRQKELTQEVTKQEETIQIQTYNQPKRLNTTKRTNNKYGAKVKQNKCCDILEKIYNKKFTRDVRPKWLRNPRTNHSLELDCYNEELKIALEYNGIQHYVWPNFIRTQTYEQFMDQVVRDMDKIDICDSHGVYLITVPYTVSFDELEDYIIERLPENATEYNE